MARKTLLTEAEIRQFMKLANIKPLQEMGGELPVPGKRDDEELEEDEDLAERQATSAEMPGKDDEKDEALAEQDDEMEMDMDAPDGGEEMEMDMEMGPEEPAPEMDMDMGAAMGADGGKEEQFADIVDKLADLLGLEADVEVGGEEMDMRGDVDADEGGELEADAAPEAPEMEMGPEEDDEEVDEPMMESDEEIVQEVARRVAARLLREKKQEDVANKLAERIFRRLASK